MWTPCTAATPRTQLCTRLGEAGVNRKYFCLISKVSSDNETLFCAAARRELLLTDVWGGEYSRGVTICLHYIHHINKYIYFCISTKTSIVSHNFSIKIVLNKFAFSTSKNRESDDLIDFYSESRLVIITVRI